MLFSSTIFIFLFLAVVIIAYYGFQPIGRNYYLLAASIFFYAWGEPKFVYAMLASIVLNYAAGILIDKFSDKASAKKLVLILAVTLNISFLFVFKYLNFAIATANSLFGDVFKQTNIALPIGISFFTFQGMSYVIDVYRGTTSVQKNPFYIALYISFFPQLIAGPIVRYNTIAEQIIVREHSVDKFSDGVRRFIIGLSKKVLIANMLAVVADEAFTAAQNTPISAAFAWMGAVAYAFQILFDFSGYSDMAIGLGKMFGFEFLENFNYPYISKTITEFWRRWHISLGTWFRDYVYIPLGGSRVESKSRLIFNLFIVWLLTGIWHGANWTFFVWGLGYFILLAFEKLTGIDKKNKNKIFSFIYRIFTLCAVLFGWVVFRAESLSDAWQYILYMFGASGNAAFDYSASFYLKEYYLNYIFAIILSTPLFKILKEKISETKREKLYINFSYVIYMMLFLFSVALLLMEAYNPFIYFNF